MSRKAGQEMLDFNVRHSRNLRASLLSRLAVTAFTVIAAISPLSAQEDGSEPDKLIPSPSRDGTGRGFSVSVSGDTAVIGALSASASDAQAVYVFVRDQTGTWTQVARLTPGDGVRGVFGFSVALDGDTLIVGSPTSDSAYIYERHLGGPNAWGETAKLTTSDVSPGTGGYTDFGYAVAISGDTAVVGTTGTGRSYVFERNHGGPRAWGEVQTLTAGDPLSADRFGESVAIRDDTIVVGAERHDNADIVNVGAVYVFTRTGTNPGIWTESAKLTASDYREGVGFGKSVSLSERTIIVGATGGIFSSGAAYVFEGDDQNPYDWREVTILTSQTGRSHTGRTDDGFGVSVSIDGDIAVVGAPSDVEKGIHSGAVYVFHRNEGGAGAWGERLKLTASDGGIGDQFGRSVSLSGTTAVAGAPEPVHWGSAYACRLDTVNSVGGACRRAVPVVNDQITMSDLTTSCCPDSTYAITATFTNTSAIAIQDPFFSVVYIDPPGMLDNVLLNADGGPGGVGATLTPDVGDAELSPGESMTVTFEIRLVTRLPFPFFVNVRGEPAP